MHCLQLDDLWYEQTVGSFMYMLFVLCIGYFSPLLGFSVNVITLFVGGVCCMSMYPLVLVAQARVGL